MSNHKYQLRRDFLLSAQWDMLAEKMRQQIEELESDPRPEKYAFKQLADRCEITVSEGEEVVIVAYQIFESDKLIDLMAFRRARYKKKNEEKVAGILRKLFEFRP